MYELAIRAFIYFNLILITRFVSNFCIIKKTVQNKYEYSLQYFNFFSRLTTYHW